jgi:hypothetical protein
LGFRTSNALTPLEQESVVLLGDQPVSHEFVDATRLTFVVPDDVECADYDVQVVHAGLPTVLPLLALPLPLPLPLPLKVIVNPKPLPLPLPHVNPAPLPFPLPLPMPGPLPTPLPQPEPEESESNFVTIRISGVCSDLALEPDETELEPDGDSKRENDESELPAGAARLAPLFQRGDTNGDGWLDITDATVVLDTLYLGATELPCRKSADANDNGEVDQADVVYILERLFIRALEVPAPSGTCGVDPTADDLPCEAQSHCN